MQKIISYLSVYILNNKLIFSSFLCSHEMRFTRAAALKGTDDMNSKRDVDVGKKGKVFEFGQLQGKINFIECSIGTEDSVGVGIICEWIEKAFM